MEQLQWKKFHANSKPWDLKGQPTPLISMHIFQNSLHIYAHSLFKYTKHPENITFFLSLKHHSHS